jgi:hypothetical protein
MVMSEEERWGFLACQQASRMLNPNLWIPDINKELEEKEEADRLLFLTACT